jgi:hypothetical protein
MQVCRVSLLFLVSANLLAQSLSSPANEPKSSAEWFIRAGERMTLRSPGSTPFHLHVLFQAKPGLEMLGPNEKSSIITGEGTYDEVWLEPHKWRREVTLADYHAIEIEGNGTRKMRASSDYEPSRVVMLLDSLFTPIPRALTSKELRDGSGWKIDHASTGTLSLIRLSKSMGSQRADYSDSYYFLPSTGVLAMSNLKGLVTVWSDDFTFDGKVVPKELTIRSADRELLTARITIEAAGGVDEGAFDSEGPAADPGMTLRPLHYNEIRMPDLSGSYSWMSNQLGPAPVFSMIGTLDRHGRFQELEILLAPNPKDASIIMNQFRNLHTKPGTIDGSPCQVQRWWYLL